MNASLPTGTVTFLFTDIEGSTILARQHPEEWEPARARHDAILRQAIERHRGFVFQVVGDSFCASFQNASDALGAALELQSGLQSQLSEPVAIRVRLGIHTGEAEAAGNDYRGYLTLSLAQRIMSAGHGGQILVSDSTERLLRDHLPERITLRDMGAHRFKDAAFAIRVFQVDTPGLPCEFPPLRALEVFQNNLPPQFTSFIGREREIDEVQRLLHETPLLTLTGAGGTGKTRLALQVARTTLKSFPDGAWLIELAPLADPELVPGTVARLLRVPEQPGRPIMTTLTDWLAGKEMLLILDNCEHVIEACARFADAVLQACPRVRILATSREALGIGGERGYHVPSLPMPEATGKFTVEQLEEYPAIRLFVERAAQVQPGFTLTDARAGAVVQICRRLDGIPLAIELAAARVKVLPVEQIAERLDDCFRLLTGGNRTALPRHQTLRSLIDWSHSLVSDPEKVFLRRLSVFAGGWTLEAAEAVSSENEIKRADVLDLLSQLVQKSLVLVEEQVTTARYRMLETIRQYAREKLFEAGEGDRVRQRHFQHYFTVAQQLSQQGRDLQQSEWVQQIGTERDNYRAALDWCMSANHADLALSLIYHMGVFWVYFLPLSEGRERLERILAGVPQPSPERARGLCQLGLIVHAQGDHRYAQAMFEQALALLGKLEDRYETARATLYLSWPFLSLGREDEALQLMERSLELFQAEDSPEDEAFVLVMIGEHARMRRDWNRARELDEQALKLLRRLKETLRLHIALGNLGMVLIHFQELDRSYALLKESLLLGRKLESQNLPYILMAFSCLANANGQPIRAVRLLGASSVLREALGRALDPGDRPDYEDNLASLHSQLDDAAFDRALQEGKAMTMGEAVQYALERVQRD